MVFGRVHAFPHLNVGLGLVFVGLERQCCLVVLSSACVEVVAVKAVASECEGRVCAIVAYVEIKIAVDAVRNRCPRPCSSRCRLRLHEGN